MAKIFAPDELPRLSSTRDKRKRIDLITEGLQGTKTILGDMIVYPPENVGSPHYHRGAVEIKYLLRGSGTFNIDGESYRVHEGHIVVLERGEVHNFITDVDEDLVFLEFWLPAAKDTAWVNPEDP
jgi:quercetin dioxygenase-like cupin family protein